MEQQRSDLGTFDLARLNEIRQLRAKIYCGGANRLFWDELESIITSEDYPKTKVWTKLEKDDVVVGDVWKLPIGEFYYKNTVHKFEYLYVETGRKTVIKGHGHEQMAHDGSRIRKIEEWYVFPDGTMKLCRKDQMHSLKNDYNRPIYVLSIKIANGTSPIK